MIENIIDNREEGKTTLRQTQLVQLKILKYVHNICEKNNINYWLDGGTLLGAVRHKGFIPWDDDLDIAMLRKDYEKFLEIAKKELPNDMFLQNIFTEKYYTRPFTRIRDKYSTYNFHDGESINTKIHKGIFIDLFPFDYVPKNLFLRKVQVIFYYFLRILKLECNPDSLKLIKKSNNKKFLIILVSAIMTLGKIIPKRIYFSLYNLTNKLFYKLSPSEDIGDGLVNPTYYFKSIRNISKIFPLKKMTFEDNEFFIPNDYKYYLETLYGDYMKLPPEEDRKVHAVDIFPFIKCEHPETLEWKTKNKEEEK